MQHRKCRRIILFPLPLEGHINPMIQLANILYSKGFSITIIHTQFNAPNPSKCPHFTFHAIPDGLLEDEASTADGVIRFSVLNSKCVEPFRDCLAKLLLDAVDQEPVACLITDAVWHFTHAVAEGFKIPTIAMRTTSISSFLAFDSFPLLLERGYFPIQGALSSLCLCVCNFLIYYLKTLTKHFSFPPSFSLFRFSIRRISARASTVESQRSSCDQNTISSDSSSTV